MKEEIITGTSTTLSWAMTAAQTDEILRYIQIGLSILATIVTIATAVYNWYKRAKADGKVTADEAKEAIDIVSDGAKEIADKVGEIKSKPEDKEEGK